MKVIKLTVQLIRISVFQFLLQRPNAQQSFLSFLINNILFYYFILHVCHYKSTYTKHNITMTSLNK